VSGNPTYQDLARHQYALGYEALGPISLCRKPQFNISCTCPSDHYHDGVRGLKLLTR
jgi:hypothetical protein